VLGPWHLPITKGHMTVTVHGENSGLRSHNLKSRAHCNHMNEQHPKMAFVKSASPVSSMKNSKPTAKRAASCKKTVKFDVPIKKMPQHDASHDGALQSTEKRRRYMRRGSKTPSMLMLASLKIDFEDENIVTTKTDYGSQKQRRLSLMSALKMSLEETAIEPKFSAPINRVSAYGLLS